MVDENWSQPESKLLKLRLIQWAKTSILSVIIRIKVSERKTHKKDRVLLIGSSPAATKSTQFIQASIKSAVRPIHLTPPCEKCTTSTYLCKML
jgi:hypothetical protein